MQPRYLVPVIGTRYQVPGTWYLLHCRHIRRDQANIATIGYNPRSHITGPFRCVLVRTYITAGYSIDLLAQHPCLRNIVVAIFSKCSVKCRGNSAKLDQ